MVIHEPFWKRVYRLKFVYKIHANFLIKPSCDHDQRKNRNNYVESMKSLRHSSNIHSSTLSHSSFSKIICIWQAHSHLCLLLHLLKQWCLCNKGYFEVFNFQPKYGKWLGCFTKEQRTLKLWYYTAWHKSTRIKECEVYACFWTWWEL